MNGQLGECSEAEGGKEREREGQRRERERKRGDKTERVSASSTHMTIMSLRLESLPLLFLLSSTRLGST